MDAVIAMAMLRGLHLVAMLSLLGTAGFIVWTLPAASQVPNALRRRLGRLMWASGGVALLAGAGWFVLQAASIAGAELLPDVVAALPLVAGHTRFGNVLLVRLALLALATLLALASSKASAAGARADRMTYLTLCLGGIALGLQGMVGHAGAIQGASGDGMIASEALHLLAAGIWLGGLLPLCLGLQALGGPQAAAVCERFSPIGLACVLLLAGSGLVQALELIGGFPALFGTQYGHIALLKIGLFGVALVLAMLNRLWLTDRLAAAAGRARGHLLLSVTLETCAGLAIVAAAAFMASSMPATHDTPVWPFSWQFSLVTVKEDPDLLRDVVVSLAVIGAAAALMIAAILLRRLRLVALGLLLLAVLARGPALKVLTVAAYPTSFQTSPTDFSAASIVQGQALFGPNCSVCHGSEGQGDGPAAAGLRIKPANLTLPHIWDHSDGELFWWLSHGMDDPEGGLAMPGFADHVPADGLWALIDYVRAHAAGVAMQQEGAFDTPLQAPAIPMACRGLPAVSMADLRDHVVHVVTAQAAQGGAAQGGAAQEWTPPPSDPPVVTLDLQEEAAPPPGSCAADDPAVWQAYAVLAGVPPDKLKGTEFLVDQNGWLRAVHRAGTPGGWDTDDRLDDAVRAIRATPIQTLDGAPHDHHH